jgi:hypothetical protein
VNQDSVTLHHREISQQARQLTFFFNDFSADLDNNKFFHAINFSPNVEKKRKKCVHLRPQNDWR